MERIALADNVFFHDDGILHNIQNKWPAMVVSGKKVTEKQAAEILIRTDYSVPDFTYAGNDKHHARRLNMIFGTYAGDTFKLENDERKAEWDKAYARKEFLGVLDLSYINNHQIVSSWIGGPHGWCNWNGDIFCNNYNIGKWPEVEDVAKDWGKIAAAFPFLDLRCQLFEKETSEDDNRPIIEFVVSEGTVIVMKPREQIAPPVFGMLNPAVLFGSTAREHGISVDELKEKVELVYGELPEL